MLLNCGVGEDSWESLGLQGDPTSPSLRKSILNIHWKDWCWSWNSNNLATWCEELTHWKRPWCWKRLRVGGEGDDRGWDGWMASLTQWTWVWVSSRSWWWTGRPGMLKSMRSQRVRHDWATELNWWSFFMEMFQMRPQRVEWGFGECGETMWSKVQGYAVLLLCFSLCFLSGTGNGRVELGIRKSHWAPLKARSQDPWNFSDPIPTQCQGTLIRYWLVVTRGEFHEVIN